MVSTPLTEPSHSDTKPNEQTAAATPMTTSYSAPAGASILNNAQNPYIAGGSFVTNNTTNFNVIDELSPLNVLYKRAAPNAILNAGGRVDQVRCHPGTREEVLGRIEKWRGAQNSQTPPIFWLSGPAGAGKTAIVQTVAENCKAQDAPQANFFFFRADPSRNSLFPLVATLVHQIVLLYPPLRDPVATVFSANPLILDGVLEDQLIQLIVVPLQAIQQSTSSYVPPTLLIDGLDECQSEEKRSQRRILRTFDKVLTTYPGLFFLLVASRDESQIRAAFNDMSSEVLPLYLDEKYSPERDIRAFVNDEFKRIRKIHPLAYMLDATWPSITDVEDLVNKSSGHFIYAATVMPFILDSSASPRLSLERVQGAAVIPAKSPFSHLDAIYTYILSQVDDQEALRDILHAHFLMQDGSRSEYGQLKDPELDLEHLLQVCNPRYTQTTICSCLADLTSIAQYRVDDRRKHRLVFHHASFPDYLLAKSRSRDYFVDLDAFNFQFISLVWKELGSTKSIQQFSFTASLEMIAYQGLHRLHQLPPGFLDTLLSLDPSCFIHLENDHDEIEVLPVVFRCIYNLCACDDDVAKCKQLLRQCIKEHDAAFLIVGRGSDAVFASKWPQYCHRYLTMAYIDRFVMTELEPCSRASVLLLPQTDSERHETALWVNELLHYIDAMKYRDCHQDYNQVLRKWVSWATWNNIPLDGMDDMPNAWWYLYQSKIEKWVKNGLGLANTM